MTILAKDVMHETEAHIDFTNDPPQTEPDLLGSVDDASYGNVVRTFHEVAEALTNVDQDLDSLLHLVAAKVCELIGVRRCSIYLKDEKSDLFRGQIAHAGSDIDEAIKRLVAGLPADRFTQEIVRTKRPVLVANAIGDPRPIHSVMRAWHVRSMLGVPMIVHGEVMGIFYLDNEQVRHPFTSAQQDLAAVFANLAAAAIIQAQLTVRLRSSLQTTARQNQLLRQASVLEERLTNLVLEGASLRQTAQTVSELTGKPCSLHDAAYCCLAASSAPAGDQEVVPRLLNAGIREQAVVAEALAALRATRSGVVGPFPAVGMNHRYLVAPVVVRGNSWGTVVVMEYGGRFTALDAVVARRAASIVALELSAEQRAASAEWDAAESFLSELVRGNRDSATLERRADLVGVSLSAPHVLVLVTGRSERSSLPSVRDVREAFAAADSDATVLAAGVAEGVALMVSLPVAGPVKPGIEHVRATAAAALERLSERHELIAAISTACRGLEDYGGAYSETGEVAEVIRRMSGDGASAVLAVDDLGAGRLFLLGSDRRTAERFVDDALGGLLDPEDHKQADLLGTLASFLDLSRSIRRCAERLGVHENTVRYRLSRVEAITGLAVSMDSEAQLTAQLALLVLRLQGRYPRAEECVTGSTGPLEAVAGDLDAA